MATKNSQVAPVATPLKALLTAIRQKTINPRPEYVIEVTGKTAAQA